MIFFGFLFSLFTQLRNNQSVAAQRRQRSLEWALTGSESMQMLPNVIHLKNKQKNNNFGLVQLLDFFRNGCEIRSSCYFQSVTPSVRALAALTWVERPGNPPCLSLVLRSSFPCPTSYRSPEVERPDGDSDPEGLAEDTVPCHGLSGSCLTSNRRSRTGWDGVAPVCPLSLWPL